LVENICIAKSDWIIFVVSLLLFANRHVFFLCFKAAANTRLSFHF